MNQKNDATEAAREEEKKKNLNIAEFLQAPRRKRKNFVVMAYSPSIRSDIPTAIDSFLRSKFGDLALTHPRNEEDLDRHFAKQIVLLIYDDEFLDLHAGMEKVKALKEKKEGAIPVLFLTRRPDELVRAYNDILLPYHESDEYVSYAKTPMNYILSKVKTGLVNRNRRRSRRYGIDLPVTFWRLSSEERVAGRVLDLSVHGALIRAGDEELFRLGDQIKVSIPVQNFLPPGEGEFLRLSAKVRRVFIAGNLAGISFEHLTERQRYLVAQFLSGVVNSQVTRQGRVYRIRESRK